MNRELTIEYEVFEKEGEIVLSVVDKEKDEVINMFKGKMAENISDAFRRRKKQIIFSWQRER